MQQLQEPQTAPAVETQEGFVSSRMASANSGESKGWKLVTSGTKRKAPALSEGP